MGHLVCGLSYTLLFESGWSTTIIGDGVRQGDRHLMIVNDGMT